ncbi:MAG TPA: ABC transporter permease subunit [Armatimonadota bacterium]|jgi:phosphate transport system permease protein
MRRLGDLFFHILALAATGVLLALLAAIIGVIIVRGAGSVTWEMITKTPEGGFYLGGAGGIANAIVGSLYIGIGATLLATLFSLPTVLFLRVYATPWFASLIRGLLDLLWGVPSIIYGAFCFILMIAVGMKTSLLAGIVVVALLELPIMARAVDEVFKLVPLELEEASAALGATKLETALRVILRQAVPGVVTGALLAFGRGVGDAASVLLTAGFTDNIPRSLHEPAATLPLTVFYLMLTPGEDSMKRAYAAALILVVLVLATSVLSRLLSAGLGKYTVR